jgi:3-methyladenine DNA glycosylase AlkD
MAVTLEDTLAQLESLGSEKVRAQNIRHGAAGNQFGIHFPDHRKRAIAIGEKLGIYRDYPVPKGCTSPFAPIWINEMVRRQS